MKERFEGASNRRRLIDALKAQAIVRGDGTLAENLADKGELVEFAKGEDVIIQGAMDDDAFLLLAGALSIIVNEAQIALRGPGSLVGEMAAIEPSLPRSATVRALETSVALKLSNADFIGIGDRFPQIWFPVAQEFAKRLSQRNATIMKPNSAPRIFIISSSEALAVAHAIRDGLEKDVYSKVWDEGVFFAGGYSLEALEAELGQADFAIAVAEADDITTSRGSANPTVRDNVVFELGLFMGKLTRYRAVLVHPAVKNLKLPSDLQGLTALRYEPGDASTVVKRVAPVCDKLRELIKKAGTRKFSVEADRGN